VSGKQSAAHSSQSIVDGFAEWTNRVDGVAGRETLLGRLDALLLHQRSQGEATSVEEPSIFSGRVDVSCYSRFPFLRFWRPCSPTTEQMPRPDAAPENDVICLQIISITEARHLFDSSVLRQKS
jgi:hypothetical protein